MASPRGERRLALKLLHTADSLRLGEVIRVGDDLVIGRANANGQTVAGVDFGLADRLLSRRHATIRRAQSGHFLVIDHDSRNGSFVRGRRVTRARVDVGAVLRFGVSVWVVCSETEPTGLTSETVGIDDVHKIGSAAGVALEARLSEVGAGSGPAIFVGEHGVGKVQCARLLHRQRHGELPLVRILCASDAKSIAADLFRQPGDSGSYDLKIKAGAVLLQQIDMLDAELQDRVLEALRRRPNVDAFATSNTRLAAACRVGAIRPDLFHWFANSTIEVPTLSERKTVIVALLMHFLRHAGRTEPFTWSGTFVEKLLVYSWPKNIRELRVLATRLAASVEGKVLRSKHLPKHIRLAVEGSEAALRASAMDIHLVPTRAELVELLIKNQGDPEKLCEHYVEERHTLYRWLERHDLSLADYLPENTH